MCDYYSKIEPHVSELDVLSIEDTQQILRQIHQTSLVESVNVGKGTRIWAFCNIQRDVSIGDNCNIGDGCFIENGVRIGDCVTIKNSVALYSGVTLENDVFIGAGVAFTNDKYPRSRNADFKLEGIHIQKGASIGANATILPGVTIGAYAMVGAGAVVTQSVGEYTLVVGNPARMTLTLCICGKPVESWHLEEMLQQWNGQIKECICHWGM